jgi:hypothetical protein
MLPMPPNQASIPILIMATKIHSTTFVKARRLRKTLNNRDPLQLFQDQIPDLFYHR